MSEAASTTCTTPRLSPWARRGLIFVLFLLFAFNFMDRQMISALLEPMKRDLGFTDGQMGAIQSGFLICIALMAAPASVLVDRWSRRKSVACMAVLWSCLSMCTGVFARFPFILGVRALAGCAQAGFKPAGVAWLSTVLPTEERARAVGIFNMALPIGAAMGTVGAGAIAQATGDWRMAFLLLPAPGILLGLLCLKLPDYKTIAHTGSSAGVKSVLKDWLALLKNKTFLFGSLASVAFTFGGFAILGWTPAYYTRTYGLTETAAGALVGSFLLLGALGSFLGGTFSDWWQKRNPRGRAWASFVLALLMVLARVGYLLALKVGVPLEIAVVLGALDVLIGTSWVPSNDTLLQDPVPARLRASAFGLAYLIIYLLGASWGPTVVGLISDMRGGGVDGVWFGFMATMPVVAFCPFFQFLITRTYIADTSSVCDAVDVE